MLLGERKNFKPDLWGPVYWLTLHLSAEALPSELTSEDADVWYKFVVTFGSHFLPCKTCRDHFSTMVANGTVKRAVTRDQAVANVIEMHNQVNKNNNRTEYSLPRARKAYFENLLNQKMKNKESVKPLELVRQAIVSNFSSSQRAVQLNGKGTRNTMTAMKITTIVLASLFFLVSLCIYVRYKLSK